VAKRSRDLLFHDYFHYTIVAIDFSSATSMRGALVVVVGSCLTLAQVLI